MPIVHTINTSKDDVLAKWLENKFDANMRVVVMHVKREGATVKPHDLVNTQVTLPDGRLLRVNHISPCGKNHPAMKIVQVETLKGLEHPVGTSDPKHTIKRPELQVIRQRSQKTIAAAPVEKPST